VTWVRATRSAASIPLGAFAPLLPASDLRLPEGVELLARARHLLAERAVGAATCCASTTDSFWMRRQPR
jgi:hypothetical protein